MQEATVAAARRVRQSQDRLADTRARSGRKADVEITQEPDRPDGTEGAELGRPGVLPELRAGWTNARPFKVGDNVFAGMGLGEIPDLDTLEIDAKVEEIDRGRIALDNDVRIRVDSLPELTITAS